MRREEVGTFRTENPRDNMALPKTKMTFEQMLEDAMNKDGAPVGKTGGRAKTESSQKFLKRKEKYDPRASLKANKGIISSKNVEKKRIFKSKNRDSENDASGEEDGLLSDSAMMSDNKSTFKNVARKSFI